MRTTITLDPDVERLLEQAQARTKASFKETVNQALRRGLAAPMAAVGTYSTPTFDGGDPLYPVENVAEALAYAENDRYS